MSKSKPESKSKPVKKTKRNASADARAKGAGIELSEDELKRVAGGMQFKVQE